MEAKPKIEKSATKSFLLIQKNKPQLKTSNNLLNIYKNNINTFKKNNYTRILSNLEKPNNEISLINLVIKSVTQSLLQDNETKNLKKIYTRQTSPSRSKFP
jgi:hypothetical protein